MILRRYMLIAVGWLATLLGLIGAVLPIMPTTPFLIVAAYCFSRASPRLHARLLSLRFFGPMLADWEQHRVIRTRAKVSASLAIALLMSYPVVLAQRELWLRLVVGLAGICVVCFIWSCRSEVPKLDSGTQEGQGSV